MAVVRYDRYGVAINALATLGGIKTVAIGLGSEVRSDPSDGAVYTQVMSLVGQKPTASFDSVDIGAVLDAVPLPGLALAGNGLIVYGYKHADGGTRAGASAHKSYTVKKGILVLRTLAADHQGDFVATVECAVAYDGTNLPVIPAESVSVPTAPTDVKRYTLGKVTINGVVLTGKRSVSIDFGISVESVGGDSEIHDTFVSVLTIQPVITIRGIDPDWFKTSGAVPLLGQSCGQTNTIIYLRKRTVGGTFVADATAEHISIAASGMAVISQPYNVAGGPAECEMVLHCRHDGINVPLVIDTTAAIV